MKTCHDCDNSNPEWNKSGLVGVDVFDTARCTRCNWYSEFKVRDETKKRTS